MALKIIANIFWFFTFSLVLKGRIYILTLYNHLKLDVVCIIIRNMYHTQKSSWSHNNTVYHTTRHLSLHANIALANALVISRLDYCNLLLHSAPVTYLDKLQRVQNSLARAVTKSPGLTPSMPLINLQWLPI